MFLFLTYFLQQNLGFSPLKTGLAFLPLSVVLVITSTTVQTRVIQRTGVKPLVLLGMALGVVGMLLFTQLTPTSSYGTGVLPGLLVIGVGMGCIFAPTFSAATLGVAPNEAGIASAMVNTSQQIGGSIGTSLLSTIYASAVTSYLATHLHVRGVASAAQVHGDTTAFWWAAGIFGLGFRARAADRAQPMRGPHGDDPGRAGPTRDRQLRPRRDRRTARPSQTARAPQSRPWRRRTTPAGHVDRVHACQTEVTCSPSRAAAACAARPDQSDAAHDRQQHVRRRERLRLGRR